MPTYRVKATLSGPLFDGRAADAAHQYAGAVTQEIAETGRDWIRIDAEGMDRSGRGGTGRAAAGVRIIGSGDYGTKLIWGDMIEGQVWWPWLEGVSQRNDSTRFKGYHTFRKVAARLRKVAGDIAERKLAEFIGRMGGHV